LSDEKTSAPAVFCNTRVIKIMHSGTLLRVFERECFIAQGARSGLMLVQHEVPPL